MKKPAPAIAFRTQPFPLSAVRLLDGVFRDEQERDRQYLHAVDTDRLLHMFRVTAGLPSSAEPLGGWESPQIELRGHFTGHFLSACALMVASTGDAALRKKASTLVVELAKCQSALGSSGYLSAFAEGLIDRVESGVAVWAPWYTLHKMFAGLLDMHVLCGDRKALEVLLKLTAWARKRTDRLDDEHMQRMLRVEFGGMPEVFWNLYAVTGDPAHAALACRFDHAAVLDPLADHRDQLKGLHANTQIPKVLAAARAYELCGAHRDHEIAMFFWHQVVNARTYATGGTSNFEYWRSEPYQLARFMGPNDHECCCTHNMLRLTRQLFSWTAAAEYADFYERALFNGILGTHHPRMLGAFMYYVSMRSGLFRIFCDTDSSYVCCSGTGIESFAKLGDSIYFHDDKGIHVNLFIPSEVTWAAKGVTLTQTTRFPDEACTELRIKTKKPVTFTLRVRVPGWATSGVSAAINGKQAAVSDCQSSFLCIRRAWHNGDRVRIDMPMSLQLHRVQDNNSLVWLTYGPLVLAGALGAKGMAAELQDGLGSACYALNKDSAAGDVPVLVADKQDNVASWVKRVPGAPLSFMTVKSGKPHDVKLMPFHRITGRRYAIYWHLCTQAEWRAAQSARKALPLGVIDRVAINDDASELEHNFQAYRHECGEHNGKPWVRSNDWFRYDLAVKPGSDTTLDATFCGLDTGCVCDLCIDGELLQTNPFEGTGKDEFRDVAWVIPATMTKGKTHVAVMFKTTGHDLNATTTAIGATTVEQAQQKKLTPRLFALATRN